jgi:hypothetical protein
MYKLLAELVTAVTFMSSNPSVDTNISKIQYYYYSTAEEKSIIEECKAKKTKYVPIKLIVQSDTLTVTQIAEANKPVKKVSDQIRFIGSGEWEFYEMTDRAVYIHLKSFTKPN